MRIKIKLTKLAEMSAKKHSSVETVLVKAQDEAQKIQEDMGDRGELKVEEDLIFHTFESGEQEYIMAPDGNGVLVVDSCTREEDDEKVASGPFKGCTISLPRPDSED